MTASNGDFGDSNGTGGNGGNNGGGNGSGKGGGNGRRGGLPARAQSLQKLFDRLPPHSIEAEMSLLGSLLLDPSVLGEVLNVVSKPEQFYKQVHGAIFKAIVEEYDEHRSGDLVQITERLRTAGMLDPVGGPEYLVELAEAVPSARNAAQYARIVADRAKLRRLIDAAGSILYEAYHAGGDSPMDAGGLVDLAEQQIFEIASEEENAGPEQLKRILSDELFRLEHLAEHGGVSGVKSGYDDLDNLTGGLQPKEMVIVAARPSMGKTALALNLAEQVAFGGRTPWSPTDPEDKPVPVGFFSLEMSKEALALRMISARAGVDAHKLRTADLKKDEWERVNRAVEQLYEVPIYVDDTPGLTVLQLRAKARRMKERHDIGALFIDYLQLLTAPGASRESRQVEVSTISRQIKSLARELDVPVICLAQLNRGAEQRERNRPRMSDLRESGSIEQDADVVMLLHREAYYHKDDEQWMNDPENEELITLTELILAKQRNGPTGLVKLTWDEQTTRFKNRDWRHPTDDHFRDDPFRDEPVRHEQVSSDPFAGDRNAAPFAGDAPKPFSPGKKSGPISTHRDGGGPDRGIDDLLDDDDLGNLPL